MYQLFLFSDWPTHYKNRRLETGNRRKIKISLIKYFIIYFLGGIDQTVSFYYKNVKSCTYRFEYFIKIGKKLKSVNLKKETSGDNNERNKQLQMIENIEYTNQHMGYSYSSVYK